MTERVHALEGAPVLVIGAGIMGAGIAQVAAQAGHPVRLFDARPGAAASARGKLTATFDNLVAKGRMLRDVADATLTRIVPIDDIDAAADVALVVEAIVEDLDVKRSLLRDLEARVGADCVLASNTSSLSITAMSQGMQHPGRLVGMHFFNPVPLMQLVEIVSGLRSDPAVAEAVHALATRWGKAPVHARSTPGFIVNRIARPYYAETLELLQIGAATPRQLDACLRGAGFRMGPCELMDLIGHDTNFAVTHAVYTANFFDKRFKPSLVQRELVDAGWLGRKSGHGFYDYGQGIVVPTADAFDPLPIAAFVPPGVNPVVAGRGPVAERLATALHGEGFGVERNTAVDWVGLVVGDAQLRLTDGRRAGALGAEVAVFDLPLTDAAFATLAWAASPGASRAWCDAAPQWLRILGFTPQRIADVPGLVVARTVAMLINEAADAVQQGVCTEDGADTAMKLGVNYPAGPFAWLAAWNPHAVVSLLDALDASERGERYRVSPWLRQRAESTRLANLKGA